ncbi:MAG: FHA domain-containing protein, partial [Solirubrobacteraceae bacterium]
MLQPVSVALKYGFLVVLYLFLVWVAWSATRDLRRGRAGRPLPLAEPGPGETGMYDAASGLAAPEQFEPRLLVER